MMMMITNMASVRKINGNDGSEDSIKSDQKGYDSAKDLGEQEHDNLEDKDLDDDDDDDDNDDDDHDDDDNNTDMVITMITKNREPKTTSLTKISY